MSRSRYLVFVLAIGAAVFVIQLNDPTGASWPVLFLSLFGVALVARALWRMATYAADSFHDSHTRGKIFTIAVVTALSAAATACASKQTPVKLVAEPLEMSALVGEWRGEYSSRETGRSGSIVFRLKSVTDTAYGDVVMISRKSIQQRAGAEAPRGGVAPAPGQVLTIRFVRMEGDRIIGRMAPYMDPDCDCRTVTTFHGAFRNPATIEGTFESSRSSAEHAATIGRWKVDRISP